MLAKDLIEQLQKCNPYAQVVTGSDIEIYLFQNKKAIRKYVENMLSDWGDHEDAILNAIEEGGNKNILRTIEEQLIEFLETQLAVMHDTVLNTETEERSNITEIQDYIQHVWIDSGLENEITIIKE